MKKQRIHFEDRYQDLTYLDVELNDDTGVITGLPKFLEESPLKDVYIGKAVLTEDMEVGNQFYYADPLKNFNVLTNNLFINKIEDL